MSWVSHHRPKTHVPCSVVLSSWRDLRRERSLDTQGWLSTEEKCQVDGSGGLHAVGRAWPGRSWACPQSQWDLV